MSNKVVARFLDGRMLKGMSLDVDVNKPVFHLIPPKEKALEVRMEDLKALFFVRTLVGNPGHQELREHDPRDRRARGATVIAVTFADGERMVGMTIRYPPNKPYYFLTPVDPKSNNIRILVNGAAVTSMEVVSGG